MNKLLKGSIAGAAGIVLLLGGAGTLAYWNDSATVASAGTVSSGELSIASTVAGTWDDSIALIVPGDSLTYTEQFTVTASGDNLSFELGENVTSIVSTIDGATVTADFDVTEGGVAVTDLSDLDAGTYTVDVEITVDFPTTVSGSTGQLQDLDLSDVEITVTQIP
ncbi:alternate-type signal peptide domain-containing protein [Salinibacterium sp. SYSU T00001]|uniref:alternate-type signal peptide domain-containing protein n=1 Tax=Homoserinimonas sedimenticola TaxID=2986805 RepID=UPI002235AE8C|nr:alternate-type signal peptide domain-containing protein [Salinibacterium sedimenticola]MCW4384822.1 alternate-type signal peptide domain-containing protein [Salinibacterium sedimenticola]